MFIDASSKRTALHGPWEGHVGLQVPGLQLRGRSRAQGGLKQDERALDPDRTRSTHQAEASSAPMRFVIASSSVSPELATSISIALRDPHVLKLLPDKRAIPGRRHKAAPKTKGCD
jgi:hypothetical protein